MGCPGDQGEVINFNPRSRVGNDTGILQLRQYIMYFNPRSRVGNDERTRAMALIDMVFQSTFPRGERPLIKGIIEPVIGISIHVPAWGTT